MIVPFLAFALVAPGAPGTPAVPSLLAPQKSPNVLFDDQGDRGLFAVGHDYKMIFGRAGVLFVPKLGMRAPYDMPLEFPATDGAKARRENDRVSIDHGAYREEYDLAPDGVEQRFVLPSRLATPVFRVPMRTELEFHGRDADGLRFEASGIAKVSYGDATLVDARGRRCTTLPRFEDDAIEFDIPEEFFAGCTYPLTIDPLIKTFSIDGGSDDVENPDVAYSSSANVYLVVYEEVFAIFDRDIKSRRFDADGNLLEETILDASTDTTFDPHVAHSAGEFLIVWRNVTPIFSFNRIKGRSRHAATTSMGATFDISGGLSQEELFPDVGGSEGSTPRFCATWQGKSTALDSVFALQCTASGVVGGLHTFSGGRHHPQITQSAGAAGRWAIVFEDQALSGDNDVEIVTIDLASGVESAGPLAVAASSLDESAPDVAGDGTDFFAVLRRDNGAGTGDVVGQHFQFSSGLKKIGSLVDVSALASPPHAASDQSSPAITYDGCRYTVGYVEGNTAASPGDVFASSFLASSTSSALTFSQSRVDLGNTTGDDDMLSLASRGSSDGSFEVLAAWTRTTPGVTPDIVGAIYQSLGPGGVTTVQTGCGTPEPTLFTGASVPALGGEFSLLALDFTSALMVVGLPTNLNLCPGQGGCKLGATPIAIVPIPSGAILPFTIPCEPALLGVSVAMEGVDLVPPNAPGASCGPPKFTQRFRTSDTVILRFQ